MVAHCSILAWRMPWMEGYSPLGCKELNMAEVTYIVILTCTSLMANAEQFLKMEI